MYHYTIGNYERISKATARKIYLNGETIAICARNLDPSNKNWFVAQHCNRRDRERFVIDEIGMKNDFNNMVNSFEYYNCINNETGRYCAFYRILEA